MTRLGEVVVSRDRAERYRGLARECLAMARTISFGSKREILTDMAQTWLQLAQEQDAAILGARSQPVMQQQQQVQPKPEDKKEK